MPSSFSPFDAAAIVIVLAAAFATFNARFLRMPQAIGLTIMGAIFSALIIIASNLAPQLHIRDWAQSFIKGLDFKSALLDGMLSFLLFAGAFQIDLKDMRGGRLAILALAVFGTIFSTIIVGFGLKLLLVLIGGPGISLRWCLVFGALISPTDPVAVFAILKDAWLPRTVQATVAAESLFNDGVGLVLFVILLESAKGEEAFTLASAAQLFVLEAGGGILFGAVSGALAFWAMRSMDDYIAEVLITLAVVMGGYAAAQAAHTSGPVAMAVAGLIMGNQGVRYAMSESAKQYVVKFWEMIDEILNSALFLIIGLHAIVVSKEWRTAVIGLAAIPIVLLARLASVGLPLLVLHRVQDLGRAALPILWWGGLRGGISIALALSIPNGPNQELILGATYAVVFFSVLVQGSTIGRLARRYEPEKDEEEEPAPA